MPTILHFDPRTRQSSRRDTERQRTGRTQARRVSADTTKLAKALKVSPAMLEAETQSMGAAGLYYHGAAVVEIEAAYRRSVAAGREAVLAALSAYFQNGYANGIGDTAPVLQSWGSR